MKPKGNERVALSAPISLEQFRAKYWLKVELQQFCRHHGLSTSGGKLELAARIETFLSTGCSVPPSRQGPKQSAEAKQINSARASEMSMETRVPQGFRCTEQARIFFVQHLGKSFRFTVALQQFIKSNPGVTLRQIAEEWRRHQELKRTGQMKTKIAPQFQYNQFTRDYFADPHNHNKSRRDCIEAWKRARARNGDHRYRREHN